MKKVWKPLQKSFFLGVLLMANYTDYASRHQDNAAHGHIKAARNGTDPENSGKDEPHNAKKQDTIRPELAILHLTLKNYEFATDNFNSSFEGIVLAPILIPFSRQSHIYD